MKPNKIVATAFVLLSSFASPVLPHVFGSVNVPVNAMYAKTKLIKFTIKNDSDMPMELSSGDDLIKLEAGKSIPVSLPIGTPVVSKTANQYHQVGDVIVVTSNVLSGAIVHIK
ncbi:hypothetical protein [Granulicella sp. dw_53]|uniref:hypothetical protein n=1 Tax=Granulicella sp. dw_53 TaxID=2719792 RepID=UPI001BD53585|nr:hypothetical protein [Granulicella sp. dw_53]